MGIGQFPAPQAFGCSIEAPPELAATGAKLCLGGLLYLIGGIRRRRGRGKEAIFIQQDQLQHFLFAAYGKHLLRTVFSVSV